VQDKTGEENMMWGKKRRRQVEGNRT
jgi:hypothetical protein